MRILCRYLSIILLSVAFTISPFAQILPSQALANPQSETAGKVILTGTFDTKPIADNLQHAQRIADLIFNNDMHRPIIHTTYSELQAWMTAAVQPYHEEYQTIVCWNGTSVSETTIQGNCLLAPLGRELYCGTDGLRHVETITEGDFLSFTVYPFKTDNAISNRLYWMRPHGALILYPLAWLAPFGLHVTENQLADGAYELTGKPSAADSPIVDVYLKTVPNHPEQLQEIRYHYCQPNTSGNWLIQGLFSNHQTISGTVAFPGTIEWIVRFVPVVETFPELSIPITYDPSRDHRRTYTVSSFEYGAKNQLFPTHFLPDVPAECTYIDNRYPQGTPERSDPTLMDYRTVTP